LAESAHTPDEFGDCATWQLRAHRALHAANQQVRNGVVNYDGRAPS
jgi:hypothetical protein